jgi:hypothetical protein
MLRPLRILFSRGSQKLKLDIRRCDFHHQFHSLVFHLDDHSISFYQRCSLITSFLRLQQRNKTTHVKKDNMDVSVSKTPLTENQSQQLISSLKEWTKKDHSDQEGVKVLKLMANMQISSFGAEQNEIVIAIVDRFLKNKQQSFHWFALFLSAIRELTLSGILLKNRHKQRIVESLSELRTNNDKRSYSELLRGIADLEINWVEINEAGQLNLLNPLEATTKLELTADCIHQIIFSFGKLGVNLEETRFKKTIIGLVRKAVTEIEKDNGKGKLEEVSRVVSLILKYDFFLGMLIFR